MNSEVLNIDGTYIELMTLLTYEQWMTAVLLENIVENSSVTLKNWKGHSTLCIQKNYKSTTI